MTFSIAAYDENTGSVGIAVASKFLAVAAVVSWAQPGTGAIATQALAKVGYGPDGLALLAAGKSASETLQAVIAGDAGREDRQVGIVDTHGGAAAHTGSRCFDWAGHRVGAGFTCQGNILTGSSVVDAMAEAYTSTQGELADRLLAALVAGDQTGGDKRGKQAAGLMVLRKNGGYGRDNDRYMDLRVDDDPEPVRRLQDLRQMHHLFFGTPRPEDRRPITEAIARELQAAMRIGGYWPYEPTGMWDTASKQAFWALVGNENLEERWNIDADSDHIDGVALDYLRRRFGLR